MLYACFSSIRHPDHNPDHGQDYGQDYGQAGQAGRVRLSDLALRLRLVRLVSIMVRIITATLDLLTAIVFRKRQALGS